MVNSYDVNKVIPHIARIQKRMMRLKVLERYEIMETKGEDAMAEVHYFISDASKQVDVESHVLRYWEDELELEIPRNDMGHRYYTEYHIRLFRQIKELKEKGYQLKAIKSALNRMAGAMEETTITEDYMEEDMKAAWNEGPAREKTGKGGPGKESTNKETIEEAPKETAENENRPAKPVSKTGQKLLQQGAKDGEVVTRKPENAELNAEKMARFQSVMNHIIGRAMDANMDRLAREVSNTVSEDVTDKVMKEVEYLMRVSDEKEEERFRQLDETIRTYQKQGKGRAEAAATKIPFFKKKKFGKSGKKMF